MVERPVADEPAVAEAEAEEKPKPKRRARKAPAKKTEPAETEADVAAPESVEEKPAKPARRTRKKAATPAADTAAAEQEPRPAADNDETVGSDDGPRRSGWWQRTFG